MKYSIVIPTYNHCEDLLKPCVETLLKYGNISNIELIISANGCTDSTFEYLGALKEKFNYLGLGDHLKVCWSTAPLGYSRATNAGVLAATTDLIVLLNNDVIILEQPKNQWLELLEAPFLNNPACGVSCVIKGPSAPAGHDFAVFFCVMIHRKVFDKIGLLNTDYGVGGGEDTEFCIEAERAGFVVIEAVPKVWSDEVGMFVGNFPVYHKAEGTVHDVNLVPDWSDIFLANSIRLAKKYNPKWYQWRISNNSERAVFFKGDTIFPREATRYKWASENLKGTKVFELGCSSGFGVQFLPQTVEYTGLDYDSMVITAAKEQGWDRNAIFVHADINQYELGEYDTIIAFETIEHLKNGFDVVEKLKRHCDVLLISVPMLEPQDVNNPHHHLHMLQESHFPGFEFKYINAAGDILDKPSPDYNVLLCKWVRPAGLIRNLDCLQQQDPYIFNEVLVANQYALTAQSMYNRNVIDIGANIGMFSLYAASLGAKKVVAVEPGKLNYDNFVSNIKRSGFNSIVPLKNLVSDKSGKMGKLSLYTTNTGANNMFIESDNCEENIATITLADILKQFKGDDIFLKIDCEGAEYDILLNANKKTMDRINQIVIEIHADVHPKYKGTKLISDKLTEFGFTCTKNDQIFFWDIDGQGNRVNWKEIPQCLQSWSR